MSKKYILNKHPHPNPRMLKLKIRIRIRIRIRVCEKTDIWHIPNLYSTGMGEWGKLRQFLRFTSLIDIGWKEGKYYMLVENCALLAV